MPKINADNNSFHWIYKIGFFILLALPILNIPPWFTPPAWSQVTMFRSLLAVLLFALLVKGKTLRLGSGQVSFQKISAQGGPASGWKEIFNPKAKIFLPLVSLLAFSFTVFISTLFSLDVSFSLWGDPNRGGGFINFFFLILFCIFSFLIIKKEDPPAGEAGWKKLLDFSLIIGFLVGLISVFQRFGILSNIFVSSVSSSTLGNTIILSLYLLPLLFLALAFFILEQAKIKKYFYLFLILFYSFVIIFITQERAAFLGILVGLFWFLIAYPVRDNVISNGASPKKMMVLKICAVLLPIVFIVSLFFFSSYPQIYEKWNPLIKSPISKITTLTKGLGADQIRISVWKISIQAFLEKPLLGYGPENFYVAFNKYYDPTLPAMAEAKNFDRAHNSLIEILIDSGIFALIFYLIFFFSLLWGLQKIKNKYPIAHGLQAGLIAYFVASLAGIDGFANVLIFFFFVAYSLHLIYSANANQAPVIASEAKQSKHPILKKTILVFAFLVLVIFLWQYNLVPLGINTNINIAEDSRKWQETSKILENEYQTKTFFSPYVNSIYLKLLVNRSLLHPEETATLSEKISQVAKNNTELQPYNPQNWLRLGESLTMLSQTTKANDAFARAQELSPKDPTILLASFMSDISAKDFKKSEDKSVYCLKTFPEIKECPWMAGLINIYSNDIEKGKNFIKEARAKGYPTESELSLSQLATAYLENKNYTEMLPIYQELISINPAQVQYKTALALLYKYLGEYDKARELALEIIKTNPELTGQIEAFLKSF